MKSFLEKIHKLIPLIVSDLFLSYKIFLIFVTRYTSFSLSLIGTQYIGFPVIAMYNIITITDTMTFENYYIKLKLKNIKVKLKQTMKVHSIHASDSMQFHLYLIAIKDKKPIHLICKSMVGTFLQSVPNASME